MAWIEWSPYPRRLHSTIKRDPYGSVQLGAALSMRKAVVPAGTMYVTFETSVVVVLSFRTRPGSSPDSVNAELAVPAVCGVPTQCSS